MKIEPAFCRVKQLFVKGTFYVVPKYQRSYAWGEEQIDDFLGDVRKCLQVRDAGDAFEHFLGGTVSVASDFPGVANKQIFEIIDGQQRLTTITILMSLVVGHYDSIDKNKLDENEQKILAQRVEDLTERYIECDMEVNLALQSTDILVLSRADHAFYRELIRGFKPEPERHSHSVLLNARKNIGKFVNSQTDQLTPQETMARLKVISDIVEEDFMILSMKTDSVKDAYRLFQVINDRGISLTEGDLLRAKTLEMTDGHGDIQNKVEKLWDGILSDEPSNTASYLGWILDSHTGKKARGGRLYDSYIEVFFPMHNREKVTLIEAEAKEVLKSVEKTADEIELCRKLCSGDWPYDIKQPVTKWDRLRLQLLVKELGHNAVVPLFLAGTLLTQKTFAELVHLVEVVFFRYKTICNQHATALSNIYSKTAISMRKEGDKFQIDDLRTQLRELLVDRADEKKFSDLLLAREYQEGGGNKPLKYFLTTVAYYYDSYIEGEKKSPRVKHKNRIYEFSDTSIEHIYPRSAKTGDTNVFFEEVKHNIGNLTILDITENSLNANDSFGLKRKDYRNSGIRLTEDIAKNATWTKKEFNKHRETLIEIAKLIFKA